MQSPLLASTAEGTFRNFPWLPTRDLRGKTLAPAWVWTGQAFESGWVIDIGGDGRVVALRLRDDAAGGDVVELSGEAVLPGFVNAHSHAFQRVIRGHTHRRAWAVDGTGPGDDDFWSWRAAMHEAAARLDPAALRAVSRLAYVEMLEAGFTAVGEFHYVHHQPGGTPYPNAHALGLAVAEAAQQAGIRCRLLRVAYLRAGFAGGEPTPGQRRFMDLDAGAAIARTAELRDAIRGLGDDRLSVGVAPHSVRAVAPEELRALAAWARAEAVPFHIHAAEQPAEVDASLAATGRRPVALLDHLGALGPMTTVVHATHIDAAEVGALAASGATVCVCPTTEADLGDGLVPARALAEAGVPLALGSDSHARIDPFEEMRRLESHERLRTLRRNQLVHAQSRRVGPALIAAGTAQGARSLALPAGCIQPGTWADLVSVALDRRELVGWTPDALADMLALHASGSAVSRVWVGGRQVVDGGRHLDAAAVDDDFREAARVLRGG